MVRLRALLVGFGLAAVPSVAWAAGPTAPDPSYQANKIVRSADFGNGAIYLGGEFTSMRPAGAPLGTNEVTRNYAAAIDADTGALLNWNPDVNGKVYSVLAIGNTVYLGGKFTTVGGVARTNLAAVDATTGAVKSWAPKAAGAVRVIVQGPNGNLFVGGGFGRIDGQQRKKIAEITPSGDVTPWKVTVGQVSGFACPPRCNPVVFTIDFSTDGQTVYFGGHFGLVNGETRREAAAVSIDNGSIVRPWDPDIYADANCNICTTNETSRVYHMIITQDKAYMCGGFWKVWHGTRRGYNVLVTNLDDGKPDPVFAAGTDGDTTGCELRNDVLYVGGHFNYVGQKCSQNPIGGARKCDAENSTTRHHAAAFDARTGEVLPWDPTANSNHGIWSIVAGPNGRMAFTGRFTKMGKTNQQMIAKYSSAQLA
jgi:hypothetical protein